MNIGIVGSRSRNSEKDFELIRQALIPFLKDNPTLTSGGCPVGGDKFAEILAKEFNLKIIVFKPDWNQYGKKAGFIRNIDIAKTSDILIAVHDGISKGTNHTINSFKKYHPEAKLILV